eukprot:CAMPEP_0203635732 /NCGR_PEP_ID=MMETSP0088-20131115/2458_2 /ASSEMBLY_ACC=CAM_ASM_001087 /TAXON_ID=426623 /ORGANISM="Chaetoceros affinis, Strain CCMP159" /LENGTH=100 /DNA_ID=CAMNT_0050489701 /DNA_START=285 /DNA_END=584 /DNA_ORIENTATION=-
MTGVCETRVPDTSRNISISIVPIKTNQSIFAFIIRITVTGTLFDFPVRGNAFVQGFPTNWTSLYSVVGADETVGEAVGAGVDAVGAGVDLVGAGVEAVGA